MKSNKGESWRSRSVRNIALGGAIYSGALLSILWLVAWFEWNWAREVFSHICHQKSDRCITVGGAALAVCARCLGIYMGIFLGCAGQMILDFRSRLSPKMFLIALIGAASANGLDALMEAMHVYANLQSLRFVLGLSLGGALAIFVLGRAVTTTLGIQARCSNRLPGEVS